MLPLDGTEPGEFKDIISDIKLNLVPSTSGIGKVHSGFKEALNEIWPDIFSTLTKAKNRKDVYFTGHSLGAAMATLAAVRCSRISETPQPSGLYTYGSPKVGNRRFSFFAKELCIPGGRWVNNVDIVTRVPLWPYAHIGQSFYMDHNGWLKKLTPLQMLTDRLKGLWVGIKRGKINYFVNHGSQKYIYNIGKNIK